MRPLNNWRQKVADRQWHLNLWADWSKKEEFSQEYLDRIQQLKNKGNEKHKKGSYREAIQCYTDAIQLGDMPGSEKAILYSNRSASYLALNSETTAHLALSDAKQVHPTFHPSHLPCIASFPSSHPPSSDPPSQACLANPSWFKGFYRKGLCYDRVGKFNKAINAYDIGLALYPGSQELKKARDLSVQERFNQQSGYETNMFDLTEVKQEVRQDMSDVRWDEMRWDEMGWDGDGDLMWWDGGTVGPKL